MIWSTPMDMFGNALDNLQETPQVSRIMLGIGLASDAVKNVPVDLLSTIPHYENETDANGRNTAAVQPA
jgi:hypothetical protein